MLSRKHAALAAFVLAGMTSLPAAGAAAAIPGRAQTAPAPLKCSPTKGKKLIWQGGGVWSYDFVKIVYWGSWWRDHGTSARTELKNLFNALGSSIWTRTLTQYCYGRYANSGAAWPVHLLAPGSIVIDPRKPPPAPADEDLGREAKWAIGVSASATAAGRSGNPEPLVVIVTPPGSIPKSDKHLCGHHGSVLYKLAGQRQGQAWVDVPYGLIKLHACGWGLGVPAALSIVAGHEWAEAVTDPFPNGDGFFGTAWATADNPGSEIGDLCSPHISLRNVFTLKLKSGRFRMQKLWSNSTGKCVASS